MFLLFIRYFNSSNSLVERLIFLLFFSTVNLLKLTVILPNVKSSDGLLKPYARLMFAFTLDNNSSSE